MATELRQCHAAGVNVILRRASPNGQLEVAVFKKPRVPPTRYFRWDWLLVSQCSHSSSGSDMPSASRSLACAAAVTITTIELWMGALQARRLLQQKSARSGSERISTIHPLIGWNPTGHEHHGRGSCQVVFASLTHDLTYAAFCRAPGDTLVPAQSCYTALGQ